MERRATVAPGSGSDGKPITITAYGTAKARPYIATNGHVPSPFNANGTKNPETVGLTGAIVLRNQQYWDINNVELSNDDDFAQDITTGTYVRDGIAVSINADKLAAGADSIMNHFRINDVYVHNTDGPSSWQRIHYGAVNFQVFGSKNYKEYGTGGHYFQDVRIENNTFVNVELHAVQFAFNWFGADGTASGQVDEAGKFHEAGNSCGCAPATSTAATSTSATTTPRASARARSSSPTRRTWWSSTTR